MVEKKTIIGKGVEVLTLKRSAAEQFEFKETLSEVESNTAIPIGWVASSEISIGQTYQHKAPKLLLIYVKRQYFWIPFLLDNTMDHFKNYSYPDQIILE